MPSGSYSQITSLQFRQALAARLDDPTNVYWLDAELRVYEFETLRTWQALTGYWRNRAVWTATALEPFYDLTNTASTGAAASNPAAFVGPTVTDQQIVQNIQYSLIENNGQVVAGNAWVGTEMFTLADVTQAMQRRLNQFLVDTGCMVFHSQLPTPAPPGSGRILLPENIIDVRRLGFLRPTTGRPGAFQASAFQPSAFQEQTGNPNRECIPLWASDEFAASCYNPVWSYIPDTPATFSVIGPPPLEMQLIPVPLDVGDLDLITVNAGNTLDPSVGVLLGIPDNFAHAVKWGALADLLARDGQPRDDTRSVYCQTRYQEAVEMCRLFPGIIQAQVNGRPVLATSIAEADAYMPDWQSVPDFPQQLATCGWNLVALVPPPDGDQPYSATVDMAVNAVIPATDGAYLQAGREVLDALLDYAQHLASFKMGGSEFTNTQSLYQRFMKQAGVYNERLQATATYLTAMEQISNRSWKLRPRRESDVEVLP